MNGATNQRQLNSHAISRQKSREFLILPFWSSVGVKLIIPAHRNQSEESRVSLLASSISFSYEMHCTRMAPSVVASLIEKKDNHSNMYKSHRGKR